MNSINDDVAYNSRNQHYTIYSYGLSKVPIKRQGLKKIYTLGKKDPGIIAIIFN